MSSHFDVAVIGGGIMGLAHAWMAARRQLRVLLVERTAVAEGASVRNFGMIWPIGQPAGELHAVALRSRALWLELGARGVLPVEECGSIHLAHQPDELAVQEEFRALGTHAVEMLTPAEVARRSPLVNSQGLLGGMYSASELRVDPRIASARIAAWLAAECGVECHFSTTVVSARDGEVRTSSGRTWRAERMIVCSGSDLTTLYPQILASSGLVLCKLQMLRTAAQSMRWPATPHLASGLTLRHYKAFQPCPSLRGLQARIANERPELDRFGIHVMVSQAANGEIILGDSHEYGAAITPFDKSEIDDLIVREGRAVFQLSDWTLRERWSGVYAKHPDRAVFEARADDGTHIFVGPGGAGMTLSFGLADRAWERWL